MPRVSHVYTRVDDLYRGETIHYVNSILSAFFVTRLIIERHVRALIIVVYK